VHQLPSTLIFAVHKIQSYIPYSAMTKKNLKPIGGQKTLFGTVLKSTPTWKCGAEYNQQFPIFRQIESTSPIYYKFVNAFARTLNRNTHALKDAKVICDNEWKKIKTNQAAVEQVIHANEFRPVSVAAPNESATQPPQQDLGFLARDVMLSTTPLVAPLLPQPLENNQKLHYLSKIFNCSYSNFDWALLMHGKEDKAFLSVAGAFSEAVTEFYALYDCHPPYK